MPSTDVRKLLLLHLAACALPAATSLNVHMLSGSEEYKSAVSLRQWADHLLGTYDINSTFSLGTDKSTTVDGLEHLESADALVVFCRRWELVPEQADQLVTFIKSGIPIVGIRTASHAFEFYTEFDKNVLGGDYSGHGDPGTSMTVTVAEGGAAHPVLQNITESSSIADWTWDRVGMVYFNPGLADDVTLLLHTVVGGEDLPVAWTRELPTGQRTFYTTLGFPADFQNPSFISMLDSALLWVLGQAQE